MDEQVCRVEKVHVVSTCTACMKRRTRHVLYFELFYLVNHPLIQEAVQQKEVQCEQFRNLLLDKEEEISALQQVSSFVYRFIVHTALSLGTKAKAFHHVFLSV